MNYNDFFNKLLLEAAMPTHNIPDGIGPEYLADDETDPEQLNSDLSVDGIDKASVEDAKRLWDNNTKIPTGNLQVKKVALDRIKKFTQKLDSYKGKLDSIPASERYSDIAILADLINRDPNMIDSYRQLVDDMKDMDSKIKTAETKRAEAEAAEREISDEYDESDEMDYDSGLPNPQV